MMLPRPCIALLCAFALAAAWSPTGAQSAPEPELPTPILQPPSLPALEPPPATPYPALPAGSAPEQAPFPGAPWSVPAPPQLPGPHTGSPEKALVGVEVVCVSTDGVRQPARRANGLLIRCDGFVLAPNSLFEPTKTGKTEYMDKQEITVILHPGTDKQKRVRVASHAFNINKLPYDAVKLGDVHEPALRLLAPDTMLAGSTARVVWSRWNARESRWMPLESREIQIGQAQERARAGWVPLAGGTEGLPEGALVVGPEEMGIGMICPAQEGGDRGFFAFTQLYQVTNCVAALPVPDGEYARARRSAAQKAAAGSVDGKPHPDSEPAAPGTGAKPPAPASDDDMVRVPGGTFVLPLALKLEQRDVLESMMACVAPFDIDRYEVTNGEYLEFIHSLPLASQADYQLYSRYWPVSWARSEPAFPQGISRSPVVGVSLEGAKAYARWRGKRLPTPYEWYVAAFGLKGQAELPPWVREYITDRRMAWARTVEMHLNFFRQNPDLHGQHVDEALGRIPPRDPNPAMRALRFGPSRNRPPEFPSNGYGFIPFLANDARWLYATDFSRDVIYTLAAPLWEKWQDPAYLLPVGTRDFDISPYGARDMILNANEMVLPNPGPPIGGLRRYARVTWPLEKVPEWATDPFGLLFLTELQGRDERTMGQAIPAFTLDAYWNATPTKLLRADYRRRGVAPADNDPLYLCVSNLLEEMGMIRQVGSWVFIIDSGPSFFKGLSLAGKISAMIGGAPIRARREAVPAHQYSLYVPLNYIWPGLGEWAGPSAHPHRELGIPPVINPAAAYARPLPRTRVEASDFKGADLYFETLGGFRCAR